MLEGNQLGVTGAGPENEDLSQAIDIKKVEQERKERFLHDFRSMISECIDRADSARQDRDSGFGREMSIAHTKLQEAKMWVGKCLEAINSPFPEDLRDEAKK